jgi:hypothetical protein
MFGELAIARCHRHDVAMNLIGLILVRRRRSPSLRHPRLSAAARGKHRAVRVALARHKGSFMADQRGAVAFETLIVYLFMVTFLLLPLADVAAAGFQFISAWGSLRGFGQSIQYNPPPDLTNASAWTSSALAKADPRFPIQQFKLVCGDTNAVCSASNTAPPTSYSYTTTFTLSPMVLRLVLCNAGSCSFTLPYSGRFGVAYY